MSRTLLAALAAVFLLSTASAQAAGPMPPPRVGGALGLIPRQGTADPAAGSMEPVLYHGGGVMFHGANPINVHLVFWHPSGYQFHSGYTTALQGFFTDVVTAGGSTDNVFSTLPQYKDSTHALPYNLSASVVNDTDAFPTTDRCSSPTGALTCLTDHQVQAELNSVITNGGLQRGLGDLYLVFLPQDVDTCIRPGFCATTTFGGYHGASEVGNGTTIYASLPDPEIEGQLPGTNTFPGGNSDAGAAIDVAAHEVVEALTDPTGTGYSDPDGYEVADKCESGPMLGPILGQAANGADYNQVINGTEYRLQEMWSNADGGCVQKTTNTSSPLPLSQVSLTQFGSTVAGNVGSNHAVHLTATLLRAGTKVASASTISSAADGSWSVSLAPHAVGDDRDVLHVAYSQSDAGAPQDQTILTGNGGDPLAEAGWTGWGALDTLSALDADGTAVVFPCFQVGVLSLTVGGGGVTPSVCDTETDTSATPTASNPSTATTLTSNDNRAYSLDDPFGALVSLTVPLGDPGSAGFPRCTADLERGNVTCAGLVPGAGYTALRSRGGVVASATADAAGTAIAAFSGSPALTGGDTVALRNVADRVVTTLHVAHLRADIAGEQTVLSGGSCQPAEYYGAFTPSASKSSSAGAADGPAGTGTICPASGSAAGLPAAAIAQTDELSAGQTQTEVPSLLDTSPMLGETVYGGFTTLAEDGLPGQNGATVSMPDAVGVSIAPATGGPAVFAAPNVNTLAGSAVPALAPGAYRATWTIVDANGDTRTVGTRFVEQAANAGPAGATGPSGPPGPTGSTGPTGPRGPRGRNARVTCKVAHSRIRCRVTYPGSKSRRLVYAAIRTGSRVVALGHTRLRDGRATLVLRPRGRLRRGAATVTLVASGLGTTTRSVRIR